jgi:hypothetical protein
MTVASGACVSKGYLVLWQQIAGTDCKGDMLHATLQSDSSHRSRCARVTDPTSMWVTLCHRDHGLAQQPVLLVFQRLHMCSKLQDSLQVLLALQQLHVSLRSAEHRAALCLHD